MKCNCGNESKEQYTISVETDKGYKGLHHCGNLCRLITALKLFHEDHIEDEIYSCLAAYLANPYSLDVNTHPMNMEVIEEEIKKYIDEDGKVSLFTDQSKGTPELESNQRKRREVDIDVQLLNILEIYAKETEEKDRGLIHFADWVKEREEDDG